MSNASEYGEPWRNDFFAGMPIIVDSSGVVVFDVQDEFGEPAMQEGVRLRIVACINACAGIPTDELVSRMQWRNEPPDKTGHWWFRLKPDWAPQVLYAGDDGDRFVAWTGNQLSINPDRIAFDAPIFKETLWAGPIAPPNA